MSLPFYNVTVVNNRTDFDSQSQTVIFSVKGTMYPTDPSINIGLPLAPGNSDNLQVLTLYDLVIDGRNEHPNLPLPIVGDELDITALDYSASMYNGRWRIVADPVIYNGGQNFNNLNSIVLRIVRVYS